MIAILCTSIYFALVNTNVGLIAKIGIIDQCWCNGRDEVEAGLDSVSLAIRQRMNYIVSHNVYKRCLLVHCLYFGPEG